MCHPASPNLTWPLLILLGLVARGSVAEPPRIPIGLDAYRQWERWPCQWIGARAFMRSTYDRRGGNKGADASHFLYQVREDFNVTLDVAGPGVLYFARYNHWHGSPWHYEVDGVDHIVEETGTADPANTKKTLRETLFLPEHLFPNPLTWTWSTTKGADLMWVPIPFERSFRMAYSRTRYGTGYYIYHQYVRGAPLSQPIRSWDGTTPPDQDVLDLIKHNEDLIESAHRFLLADLMPFGHSAVIRLEHGGENQSTEHYESVVYWYGAPYPTLIQTDDLKIGDLASEQAHRYESSQASPPYPITSRYEWGVDSIPMAPLSETERSRAQEIYPAHTDTGRKTTGTSEFSLQLRPDNFGVLLRRRLDYAFPNQRAEVFVADDSSGQTTPYQPAGIWYLAGANTCVYSNPSDELGATQHIVQTSNRQFRDDEFLVPRDLTEGRTRIRVRIRFTPVKIPLFPAHPAAGAGLERDPLHCLLLGRAVMKLWLAPAQS
jgi:hypothetical protein